MRKLKAVAKKPKAVAKKAVAKKAVAKKQRNQKTMEFPKPKEIFILGHMDIVKNFLY